MSGLCGNGLTKFTHLTNFIERSHEVIITDDGQSNKHVDGEDQMQ